MTEESSNTNKAKTDTPDTETKPVMGTKSAVRWSAFSSYGALALRFIVSIITARLLLPEAFGLYSMAYLFVGLVNQLKSVGFSAAIVQRKELPKPLLNAIYWCNLAICLLIGLAICCVAPLSASWFDKPILLPLTMALALTTLSPGLSVVPASLLQKKFAFNKLAIREIGEVVAGGTTMIVCALLGFDVWSLVFGEFASAAYRIISLNIANPFIPGFKLDIAGLRQCLGFGLNVTVSRIMNYVTNSADTFIIGLYLGPFSVGIYGMASKYMRLPRDLIDRLANRVLFSVFCRDQDDPEKLADVFLRARTCTCLVIFPVMAGLSILADPFVRTLLGEKWVESIPLLSLLAVSCAIESVGATNKKLLIAKARGKALVILTTAGSLLRLTLVLVAVQWGILAVAIAHVIGSVILTPISLKFAMASVPLLTMRKLSLYVFLSFLPTAVMSLILLGFLVVADYFSFGSPHTLIIGTILGGLTYLLALSALKPPGLKDIVRVLPARPSRWLFGSSASKSAT